MTEKTQKRLEWLTCEKYYPKRMCWAKQKIEESLRTNLLVMAILLAGFIYTMRSYINAHQKMKDCLAEGIVPFELGLEETFLMLGACALAYLLVSCIVSFIHIMMRIHFINKRKPAREQIRRLKLLVKQNETDDQELNELKQQIKEKSTKGKK